MNGARYRFGEFILLPAKRELLSGGQPLALPRRVFDCINYLLQQRDRAVGRDELVQTLWGRTSVADTQLSQLMRRVRHTIGDDGQKQEIIRTVPGFGYRWIMAVEALESPRIAQEKLDGDNVGHERKQAGRAPSWRAGWIVLAVGCAIAMLTAYVVVVRMRDNASASPHDASLDDSVVVLPIDVDVTGNAGWIRLGAMDLVADRLRNGGLRVAPSETVIAALHATKAEGEPARLEGLRRALGARIVVYGMVSRFDNKWRLELHTTRTDGVEQRAEATDADVLRAARNAADQLVAGFGHVPQVGTEEDDDIEERVQRVRAALLADQLDTARILLLGDSSEPADDPRLRYWLAKLDFRADRLDEAGDRLTTLLADPRVISDVVLHGRVLVARAGTYIRRADYVKAETDFDAATSVLSGNSGLPEFGEALAGRGVARTALHRFDEASADLGRARIQLDRAGDPFDIARVDANLGMLELERGRPGDAIPYLKTSIERFESFGAISQLLSALNALFDAQARMLQWPDALATSERRLALGKHASDPMQRYIIGVDRARALMAMGRDSEAQVMLVGIGQEYPQMRAQLAIRLHAQRAQLALRQHQPELALAAARITVASGVCHLDEEPCAAAALVYQRASILLGKGTPAQSLIDDHGSTEARPFDLEVAQAEWEAFKGHDDIADSIFVRTFAAAEAEGVPAHVALVGEAYGYRLLAERRLDRASALVGRIAPWADHDFDCALLQVALLHAYGDEQPWSAALKRAQSLAGERRIPDPLLIPPKQKNAMELIPSG